MFSSTNGEVDLVIAAITALVCLGDARLYQNDYLRLLK